MSQIQKAKVYDLEERTAMFVENFRDYTRTLERTIESSAYIKQCIRSTGSVATNYIEANESLSKKDFVMRTKICRKEAKESALWLRLLNSPDNLIQEATELTKIFGAILEKSK